jgi:DNA modification methylase
MAVNDQLLTDRYALYNGDCVETMKQFPAESIHFTVYSPPFKGLYQYSSDEADLSNSVNYEEFLKHYAFVVKEIHRITMPGRMSAVHCMDVPSGNSGCDHLQDFPGDIIRLHAENGFHYVARYHVWKEPLTIRNRTMMKSLSHKCLTLDSTKCSMANADYLLIFRRSGDNPVPVSHPTGLLRYAGERDVPAEIKRFRGWTGSQLENRFSQWVWRQYASAFWDDVRLDNTLPHREGKDPEDEKHVHPLQLDVIERACVMWSNPGEVVLTPFMGVGSEVFGAVKNGRKGVGIELKPSYYRQACRNLEKVDINDQEEQMTLLKE